MLICNCKKQERRHKKKAILVQDCSILITRDWSRVWSIIEEREISEIEQRIIRVGITEISKQKVRTAIKDGIIKIRKIKQKSAGVHS